MEENQQKLMLFDWIKKVNMLGCGEILLTSIDFEGTREGFDYNFLYKIALMVSKCPAVASGGAGNLDHIKKII